MVVAVGYLAGEGTEAVPFAAGAAAAVAVLEVVNAAEAVTVTVTVTVMVMTVVAVVAVAAVAPSRALVWPDGVDSEAAESVNAAPAVVDDEGVAHKLR